MNPERVCLYLQATYCAAPTQATQVIIIHSVLHTTLGLMFVCAIESGSLSTGVTDLTDVRNRIRDIQRLFNARIVTEKNSHTRQTVKRDQRDRTRRQFDLSVDALGDFQQSVWRELQVSSYGRTPHTIRAVISLRIDSQMLCAVAAANGYKPDFDCDHLPRIGKMVR